VTSKNPEYLHDVLKALNFYAFEENLPEIVGTARFQIRKAREEGRIHSSLLCASSHSKPAKHLLALDIGGTSTKLGLCVRASDGKEKWELLFEKLNEEFNDQNDSENSLKRFARAVAEYAAEQIDRENGYALGLVWSNALKSFHHPLGVNAKVIQRDNYAKSEWFIADLKDGDDIGTPFLEAFAACGIEISSLVVANDVVFTMKALPGAHAGMVASTGVNATLVFDGEIYNGQLGDLLELDARYLSVADRVGEGVAAKNVQEICAGAFLPRLLTSYIMALRDAGVGEFRAPGAELERLGAMKWERFSTIDLDSLIEDPANFDRAHPEIGNIAAISALSREIILRSAKAASLVALMSVENQTADGKDLVIALDSRLAREMGIWREEASRTLVGMTDLSRRISFSLLNGITLNSGTVSVPGLGSAVSL